MATTMQATQPVFQVRNDAGIAKVELTRSQFARLHGIASDPTSTGSRTGATSMAVLFGVVGVLVVRSVSSALYRYCGISTGRQRQFPARSAAGTYVQEWHFRPEGLVFVDSNGPAHLPWSDVKACYLSNKQITLEQRGGGRYRFSPDVFPPQFLQQIVHYSQASSMKVKTGSGNGKTVALLVALTLAGGGLYYFASSLETPTPACATGETTVVAPTCQPQSND